ncbi:transcription factor Jun-like [Ambystoma mexicanum]|uniref:transcription factor Jun-like n=1 Tax=Ambystoma mexicanum TaxID=8296 RepID=UPI0037E8F1B5
MMMTTTTADHVKMESTFYHEEALNLPDFAHISAGYTGLVGRLPVGRYQEQKLLSAPLHGQLKKKSSAALAAVVVPPPGAPANYGVVTRGSSALKLLAGPPAGGGSNLLPVITVAGISVGPAAAGIGRSSSSVSPEAPLLPPAPQSTLSLLKLASPELEHLIIQANPELAEAAGIPSPPPPQQPPPPFLYRSQAITQEQEGFADGFVKALADLHKQNQLLGTPLSPSAAANLQGAPYPRNLHPSGEVPVYTNLSSFTPAPASQLSPPGASYSSGGIAFPALQALPVRPQQHRGTPGLDESQTVPEGAPGPAGDPCGGVSPPSLSPMDPETQERIKAERKRLRNRIAASKCRKRKLERIARLEEKVKVLKSQNSDLASTASLLREQVSQLKQKVLSHVTSGCQIAASKGSPGGKSGEGASC